jgi:hypothetical protein
MEMGVFQSQVIKPRYLVSFLTIDKPAISGSDKYVVVPGFSRGPRKERRLADQCQALNNILYP